MEDEHREAFVEIYEATPEQRLVTSIEVLSPSNKRPGTPGWDLYLRKRQSMFLGEANLVEIDLLRGGPAMPMLDPWPDSPYTFLVARPEKLGRCQVSPVHFQTPCPSDPRPAGQARSRHCPGPSAADRGHLSSLALQRTIDYSKPLEPPLGPAETAWLRKQRRAQRKPS